MMSCHFFCQSLPKHAAFCLSPEQWWCAVLPVDVLPSFLKRPQIRSRYFDGMAAAASKQCLGCLRNAFIRQAKSAIATCLIWLAVGRVRWEHIVVGRPFELTSIGLRCQAWQGDQQPVASFRTQVLRVNAVVFGGWLTSKGHFAIALLLFACWLLAIEKVMFSNMTSCQKLSALELLASVNPPVVRSSRKT